MVIHSTTRKTPKTSQPAQVLSRALRSIRARLILGTLIPATAFLLLGVFLTARFTLNFQQQEFDASLEEEILQLSAWAQVTPDGLFDPKLPGDTQYERTFSGWYYQVFQVGEAGLEPVATSPSLQLARLNVPVIESDEARWRIETVGPTGEPLIGLVQRLSANTLADGEAVPNPDLMFLLVVARDATTLHANQAQIIRGLSLAAVFAAFALGTVTLVMVRFGLLPLGRVEQGLARIRSGDERRLDDDRLPVEIEPLAAELNLLIDENEKVVERARTQVGNLAHALKTPLSVLVNDAAKDATPLGKTTREQVSLMRDQVDRYLARARVAATSKVIGMRTSLAPVFERLTRALQKIHADKGVELRVSVDDGLFLRGEQQDLEEVAGNVLENAFKWADGVVALTAERRGADIVFWVEDDGPGLAPDERQRALERGQRFDETTPGTGLGLSIVADIVSAYGGSVDLGESEMGGLKVTITLPSAG